MTWQTFLLFLGLTAATSVMPGPNAMMTMAQGIAHGSRGAFWTIMGSFAALGAMMIASAVGARAILMASELAFEIVKWAGVAYLAYLGVKSWRAPPTRAFRSAFGPADSACGEGPGGYAIQIIRIDVVYN